MESDGESYVHRTFTESLSKKLIFKQKPFMELTWAELQFIRGATSYTCIGPHKTRCPQMLCNYITENQSCSTTQAEHLHLNPNDWALQKLYHFVMT